MEHPGSVEVVNPGPVTPPPPPPPPDTTPPTISLVVTPTSVAVGAPVTAAATVTDNVGIERVEFYLNGNRRVTNTVPPFTYVWNTNGALPGNYRLSARAYDKAGNNKLSNEVTVTVGTTTPTPTPPTPTPPPIDTTKPTVSLSAPVAGTNVNIGSTVNITAAASDNVGVTKVEFYSGTTLLGSDTALPYSYAWNTNGQTIGTKSLTAKAYDAAGNIQTSAAVSITLNAPGSAIPGDANNDNRVNALDLSILLSKDGQAYPPADFDKNSTIGAGDLAILLGKWTW